LIGNARNKSRRDGTKKPRQFEERENGKTKKKSEQCEKRKERTWENGRKRKESEATWR
jgi:hypothetical protein